MPRPVRAVAPDRPAAHALTARLAAVDWKQVGDDLDQIGHARLESLLSAAECRALIGLYRREELFRSRVDMARHRFGEGEYRYFASPLPPLVAALRRLAYPPLAAVANRWQAALGEEDRFPASLAGLARRCRAHGQARPTPLLLRYTAGGYNCLHQDLYGEVAFPLQVTVLLSRPGDDFAGGEFLLVEQRPRAQSRGTVVALGRGDAVVFPTRIRPLRGSRGAYRGAVRHGVSRLTAGSRYALGVIFHDAR